MTNRRATTSPVRWYPLATPEPYLWGYGYIKVRGEMVDNFIVTNLKIK